MASASLDSSYLELIINQSPDMICKYSLDKKIIFINETVHRAGGQVPQFYVGKSIYDFGYPPDFLKSFESGFDACARTKQVTSVQIHVPMGAFANTHFIITFVPILISQQGEDKLIGIFSVSRNATKEIEYNNLQKEKIEELQILSQRLIRKANKLQDFAHIVSHNLRSPISNLAGLFKLYDHATNDEERAEIIGFMKKTFYSLGQTIEDLNEVVKINQHVEVKIEKLYFVDILLHVQESISLSIVETDTLIECDFSACDAVQYNKAYMESIMLNLLTNAIKYRSPERRPHVRFFSYLKDNIVHLVCKDNGLGINLQKHGHKIFGLHKTFHGNQDARGVGLYITKNQIEAMGGTISVESIEGEGTTFTLQLTIPPINEEN